MAVILVSDSGPPDDPLVYAVGPFDSADLAREFLRGKGWHELGVGEEIWIAPQPVGVRYPRLFIRKFFKPEEMV